MTLTLSSSGTALYSYDGQDPVVFFNGFIDLLFQELLLSIQPAYSPYPALIIHKDF